MDRLLPAGDIPPEGIKNQDQDSGSVSVYPAPKRDQSLRISTPDQDGWACVQEMQAYRKKVREEEGYQPNLKEAAAATGWSVDRYLDALNRPFVRQQLSLMLREMAVTTVARIQADWFNVLDAQIAVASNPEHPGTTRAAQWLANQIERLQEQVEEKQDAGKGGKSRALALLDQLRAKAGQVTATEVTRTVTLDVESAE